ncbi:hypothetical protein P5V15_009871 [Pogonomyrmex californicus]
MTYVFCHNSSTNSTLINEEKILEKSETIMLEQQINNHDRVNDANCHVIELSNNDSKKVLQRQLQEITERGSSNLRSNAVNCENMEILRKLPPDTIVIRQKTKSVKENNDFRKLTETNNNQRPMSSCTVVKMRGISRTLRSKTLKTMEIKDNPIRVSKRNMDKNFSRPKQRLLVNSKREIYSDYESRKRIKLSTMPYMNTRSVTRKMYTVGATYQAPTKKDEMEWKEWPVHGMHERPIYHPQTGLAVEYLGRYFTSLDGLSYCEIIDKADIEVVSVEPYCNKQISSTEEKSKGKTNMKMEHLLNTKNAWNIYLSMNNKSFETCMHESLHYVLGYCSQIMTPVYKQAVEKKMTNLMISAAKLNSLELADEMTKVQNNATISSKNEAKLIDETKLLEAYAIAMAQNIQNESNINNTNTEGVISIFPSFSVTQNIPEAQKSSVNLKVNNSKTNLQNNEIIKMKQMNQIIQDASNNSLILLDNTAARSANDNIYITTKNLFNSEFIVENTSNNETLIGTSSSCNKLVFADEPISKCKESQMNNNLLLTRHTTNIPENMTKIFFENLEKLESKATDMKKAYENKSPDKRKINRQSDDKISMTNIGKNFACINETSKIARILSEYNESTLRRSMIKNQNYNSKDMKTNLINSNIKNVPKNLWQKNIIMGSNQQFISNPNADFPQEKWKKFHVMLKKTKDGQFTGNNNIWERKPISLEDNKTSLMNQQMNLSTLNYTKEKFIDYPKNEYEIVAVDMKREREKNSKHSEGKTEVANMEPLQKLLENTAILYCAATGVHQDDLSNYIDTLDSKQTIQWLENCNNS